MQAGPIVPKHHFPRLQHETGAEIVAHRLRVEFVHRSLEIRGQFHAEPTPLAKNTFMAGLRDRNETLYYKLIVEHLTEMLPIVYDPVVGEAIEQYSEEYRRPRGVYLSVDDPEGV